MGGAEPIHPLPDCPQIPVLPVMAWPMPSPAAFLFAPHNIMDIEITAYTRADKEEMAAWAAIPGVGESGLSAFSAAAGR